MPSKESCSLGILLPPKVANQTLVLQIAEEPEAVSSDRTLVVFYRVMLQMRSMFMSAAKHLDREPTSEIYALHPDLSSGEPLKKIFATHQIIAVLDPSINQLGMAVAAAQGNPPSRSVVAFSDPVERDKFNTLAEPVNAGFPRKTSPLRRVFTLDLPFDEYIPDIKFREGVEVFEDAILCDLDPPETDSQKEEQKKPGSKSALFFPASNDPVIRPDFRPYLRSPTRKEERQSFGLRHDL